MRIIIYGINFFPELTGIGKYTGEMAFALADRGNDVTVVTAMPYYPEWEVHKEYQSKWWHKETINKVKVYRCPLYVPKNITSAKRILHEFSFLFSVLPIWFLSLFKKKYDLVICVSPPFHLGFLPLLYKWIRGAKLVSHIQDLQVDAAKELGMIKNTRFLNLMFNAEKFILRKSSAVSTISTGMQRKIVAKGIPDEKIIMFPNWVDETVVYPVDKEHSLRQEFGIALGDKVILYSGNLGEKQGLEIIIDVARNFRQVPNVHFIIVGSGGGKQKLEQLVRDAGLSNIRFFPLQPYEKLSALLAIADLHLVLQKKSASDLVMPSKLTGILAVGGCAIVTAVPGTSLYDTMHSHNLGIIVEPENPASLTSAILNAFDTDLSVFRSNSLEYARTYLLKKGIIDKFNMDIKKI